MKKSKWVKMKSKMQFGEKKGTGMLNVTAKACARREAVTVEESSTVKERSALPWSKGKGALRERPHPAKLPACEGT